jgi:uncharacterized protein
MPAPDDCQKCGVCCFSQLETYVRVSGEDWARLGADAETLAHFIGHRAYLKLRDGHCAALDVRGPPATALEFFCTVYERRPQICRDLARGSAACEGERASKSSRVEALKAPFPRSVEIAVGEEQLPGSKIARQQAPGLA